MAHTVVVRGHIVGSTTVRVDEPIPPDTVEVEVILHVREKTSRGTVGEYIRSLPPGTRTKEDIDHQIREERDSWRD